MKAPGWDDLCGEHDLKAVNTDVRHPFDADASGIALDLGGITVFVFEDPSDGYRSSASAPLIGGGPLYEMCSNVNYIFAPVLVLRWTKSEYGRSADGIEIIDRRNGKTVLTLGTDNSDDYYPSFECRWEPKNLAGNMGAS